jgi:hypothetical protein
LQPARGPDEKIPGDITVNVALKGSLLKQLNGAVVWSASVGYVGSVLTVARAIAYLSFRYIERAFLRYKPE